VSCLEVRFPCPLVSRVLCSSMSGLKAHEGKPFVFMLGPSVFECMPDARRHV
jgi:hypothetical protein